MPVLGIIFLRHAGNRYDKALAQITADQASGKMPSRPLVKGDFIKRRALLLPENARYDSLLKLPTGASLGAALVEAMNAIEDAFEPLRGQLPKEYAQFDDTLLENLLRTFDSEAIRTAGGDLFGRIYEYFLMKFAMQGAQDNGEFFTPPSLVQTIVNVIEPDPVSQTKSVHRELLTRLLKQCGECKTLQDAMVDLSDKFKDIEVQIEIG